jgi:hypothetical protein
MRPIENWDGFFEEHGTLVAFLVPFLALLASFLLIALV